MAEKDRKASGWKYLAGYTPCGQAQWSARAEPPRPPASFKPPATSTTLNAAPSCSIAPARAPTRPKATRFRKGSSIQRRWPMLPLSRLPMSVRKPISTSSLLRGRLPALPTQRWMLLLAAPWAPDAERQRQCADGVCESWPLAANSSAARITGSSCVASQSTGPKPCRRRMSFSSASARACSVGARRPGRQLARSGATA